MYAPRGTFGFVTRVRVCVLYTETMHSHLRSLFSVFAAVATARRYGFVTGNFIPDIYPHGRLHHGLH